MSKEEILEKVDRENYKRVTGEEKPVGYRHLSRNSALECMDEYAKEQVIEFQKWTNLNGWFWSPNRWLNYHGDPTPMSTEELYTLFLNQQSK